MHSRLGSATLSQPAFPGEINPNFLWEKSQWDNTVVKTFFFNIKYSASIYKDCQTPRQLLSDDVSYSCLPMTLFAVVLWQKEEATSTTSLDYGRDSVSSRRSTFSGTRIESDSSLSSGISRLVRLPGCLFQCYVSVGFSMLLCMCVYSLRLPLRTLANASM